MISRIKSILRHLRLFRPDRRPVTPDWPTLSQSRPWRVEQKHLMAFLENCPGWDNHALLPPTYPQVVAVDLHLRLLGDARFPYQPMGLVHISNRIELVSPMPVDQTYRLCARLKPGGEHPRGALVVIETMLYAGDDLVWRSQAIALKITRDKTANESDTRELDQGPDLSADRGLDLPEDLGRRYARIAGDLNPIHQRAWMARPFGFEHPILHGMWTLAWAIQPLPEIRGQQNVSVDVEFVRPVSLPGRAYVGFAPMQDGLREGRLWSREANKPSLRLQITRRMTFSEVP